MLYTGGTTWPWQEVDARSLTLTWQTLAAMVSISSVVVSVAVVYLRLFVDSKLSSLRTDILSATKEDSDKLFLAKSVGELVQFRLSEIERRMARMEDEGHDEQRR